MKKVILMFLLLASFPAFSAGTAIKIGVNGMVCGFCAQGITKKFKAEPSVETVDVNLSDKLVKLNLKENQDISNDRIGEILKDAGYNVTSIERK